MAEGGSGFSRVGALYISLSLAHSLSPLSLSTERCLCVLLGSNSKLVAAGGNQRNDHLADSEVFFCSTSRKQPRPQSCLFHAPPAFCPASLYLHHPWRRDECIILATQGTGGKMSPELRTSPKLLELHPVLLPGALVVRQTIPLSGSTGRDWGERATGAGAGRTEAFRLPGKREPGNQKRSCMYALQSVSWC